MKLTKLTVALGLIIALAASLGCEDKAEDPTEATAEATETPTNVKGEQAEADDSAAQEDEAEMEDGGAWVTSEGYGVKFRVPDDWKVKKNEEAVSATSPDDTITVILVGTESEGVFETAMGSVSQQLELSELKTERTKMTVVNGLAGFHGRGTAVLKNEEGGQEIQFLGYALKLEDSKGIAMMIFAEAEMYEARKEEIEGIAKTLQSS